MAVPSVRRFFLGVLPLMPIVLIMGVPGFGVSSPLSCVSVSLYDIVDVYKIYGGDHFIICLSPDHYAVRLQLTQCVHA